MIRTRGKRNPNKALCSSSESVYIDGLLPHAETAESSEVVAVMADAMSFRQSGNVTRGKGEGGC